METKEMPSFGLRLLKKGKRGILRIIFSRTGMITLLLLFNFLLVFGVFFWLYDFLPHVYSGISLFSLGVVLFLFNSKIESSAKLTWLVLIMLMPVFGCILYLFTLHSAGQKAMTRHLDTIMEETSKAVRGDAAADSALLAADPGAAAMTRYVRSCGSYPVFTNTQVTYFPSGEEKFQALLTQLTHAEKFIFLEYFILEEGFMWGNILDILAQKAAQGVEVRLLYDGTCEFSLLPKDYPKRLHALGIQCRVFAPVTPFVSTHYNYRDHRKIVIIDGHTAFNGGINLADEYIGKKIRYGHWKDTAVMLRGNAVQSFTLMFLQLWALGDKAAPWQPYLTAPCPIQDASGFVMPYGESPLDGTHLGQQVYVDILNRAQRYVHIMTPYLILNDELENALCYCARRGVSVVLLLPGIPDKRIPYALAKTHYRTLLDAGVAIREYTPGFVHAKVFVCDDREAVVGTINLDYRSLYHHFECATYLHSVPCIEAIEKDFQATLALCRTVTPDTLKKEPLHTKLLGYLFKVVAPLL